VQPKYRLGVAGQLIQKKNDRLRKDRRLQKNHPIQRTLYPRTENVNITIIRYWVRLETDQGLEQKKARSGTERKSKPNSDTGAIQNDVFHLTMHDIQKGFDHGGDIKVGRQ
jgi:hypothetical protein